MTYGAPRGGKDAWAIGNFTPDMGFRRYSLPGSTLLDF
jgi:hypothetical protein